MAIKQTIPFNVDLRDATETQSLPNILIEGDENAYEIEVSVFRDGVPVDLTGAEVYGYGMVGSTTAVSIGTANGNKARFDITGDFCLKQGTITIDMNVQTGETVYTVFRCQGKVQKSAYGNPISGEVHQIDWGNAYLAAINEPLRVAAEEARETAEAARQETITRAETATADANDATRLAVLATCDLNQLKEATNAAAQNALDSAVTADKSAENANNAKSEVDAAIDGMVQTTNQALDSVSDAIQLAENAAERANNAAKAAEDTVAGGLPKATRTSIGAVIAGANLGIDENGVLSADVSSEDIDGLQESVDGMDDMLYREDIDATAAHEKSVPADVLPWATLDKVGAKTMVWNQLQPNNHSGITGGVKFEYDDDKGTLTISATGENRSSKAYWLQPNVGRTISFIQDHKYMIAGVEQLGRYNAYIPSANDLPTINIGGLTDSIITMDGARSIYLQIMINDTFDLSTPIVVRPQIFDLTAMFGAERAETMTAEEFRAMFPADYYPYSEPILMSYEPDEVVSRGRNLANGYRDPITYTYADLIQKYFPNGMHSAGAVYDEIDLERGVAVQRVGSMDLGDVSFGSKSSSGFFDSANNFNENAADVSAQVVGNIVCALYAPRKATTTGGTYNGISLFTQEGATKYKVIRLYDDTVSTVPELLAKVSGVPFYFELAEPIETHIDPADLDGLTALNVEAGGSLTFKNQHGEDFRVPLPSQVTFKVRNRFALEDDLTAHTTNAEIHVTAADKAKWDASQSIVSDAYSKRNTYAVGDYCISGNWLWKCKVACSGVTPTEGTYWTKVLVANELIAKQDKLNVNVLNTISQYQRWTPSYWRSLGGNFTISDYGYIIRVSGTAEPSMTGTRPSTDNYFMFIGYGGYFAVGQWTTNTTDVLWTEFQPK